MRNIALLPLFYLLLLGLCVSHCVPINTPESIINILRPHHTLYNQTVVLDGTTAARYGVADTKPNTRYQVRVSHSAAVPASVRITITTADPSSSHQPTTHNHHRRLLDTEQAVLPLNTVPIVVHVYATPRSPHRDGPLPKDKLLSFNIGLTPLWLGIPTDALGAAAAVMILLTGAWFLAPWCARVALPAGVTWITEGHRETRCNRHGGGGTAKPD